MAAESNPPFFQMNRGWEAVMIEQSGNKERRLLDVSALSKYLSMPKATIYTQVSLRKMPGVVHIGRSLRFDIEAIDRWLNEKRSSQGQV